MSTNVSPTNTSKRERVKKLLKAPFSRSKHRNNPGNLAAGSSNLQLSLHGEALGHPPDSASVVATAPQTQMNVQTAVIDQIGSAQNPAGLESANVPTSGSSETIGSLIVGQAEVQVPIAENKIMHTDYTYLKLAGAVLEKSVFTLKKFSDLIPVPGLAPAINAVCACIEHYHQISENKEKLEKLAAEVASKSQALQKHWKQDISFEMEEQFKKLAE
ncbi:hypothetical protein VKT23_020046 [Stygiomarasmius scandens]|uniref:Uncharacterized protein n=1 Tax=Marasmiellus scandens TaxID=2682957 RepID=A0ABR1ILD3_9AGAR